MRDYDELYDKLIEELVVNLQEILRGDRCAVASDEDFPALKIIGEAIDAIKTLQKCVKLERSFADAWEGNAYECRDRFQKLLAAFPKWISVNEKLPEKEGYYITAFRFGDVGSNFFMRFNDGKSKWYQNSKDTGEVTHWMPFPNPPKEET